MIYTTTVSINCETAEQANQVLAERLGHDEDYGFDYTVDYKPVREPLGGVALEGHPSTPSTKGKTVNAPIQINLGGDGSFQAYTLDRDGNAEERLDAEDAINAFWDEGRQVVVAITPSDSAAVYTTPPASFQ